MVDMDCVKRAVECCKKYEYLQTLVVVNDANDYENILNYLRTTNKDNHLRFSKQDMIINCYFRNGSVLRIRSKNNTARGIQANLLLYDDAIDENVLNTVFRPMIRPYVQNGLNLHHLGYN